MELRYQKIWGVPLTSTIFWSFLHRRGDFHLGTTMQLLDELICQSIDVD